MGRGLIELINVGASRMVKLGLRRIRDAGSVGTGERVLERVDGQDTKLVTALQGNTVLTFGVISSTRPKNSRVTSPELKFTFP